MAGICILFHCHHENLLNNSGLHSLHIWSTSKLILAPLDASLELLYYAYSIIIYIKT